MKDISNSKAALALRIILAVLLGLTFSSPVVAASNGDARGQDQFGLRDYAVRRVLRIGTAVDVNALQNEEQYRQVLAREFNSVTPENVMKWDTIEPVRGQLNFEPADQLVDFARRHGQIVRGHTLVWHSQLPSWLTNGNFTNQELEEILRQHIYDVVRHFKGKVYSWDVVNEPLNEDGTLRDIIWLRALGPDYIAKAFRWAHEADPHAKLYINDYNIEWIGPKSNGMYELVKSLKEAGVPIDGVGFQGHLGIQYGFPGDIQQNMQRFADLGLDVALSEVDVRMILPVTQEKLTTQAEYYRRLMDACLNVRRCVSFTVWGFTDAHSWVPGFFQGQGAATIFDENYQPKPAYFALKDELTERSGRPQGKHYRTE